MFLSIVIPVYNAEKFLQSCADSLIEQDIPTDHYEILFVNDGSTDDSENVLKKIAADAGNIRVVTQVHQGVSAARNLGLQMARGEYIWFVDADDFIANHVLGLIEKTLTRSHADRLIFRAYEFFDSLDQDALDTLRRSEIQANTGLQYVSACCSIFSRKFLMETGVRFRENLVTSEDSVFLFELSMMKPKEVSLERVLYFYRRNPGSATMGTRIRSNSEKLDSFLAVSKIAYQYYQERKGDPTAAANLMMSNLWMYLHLCTRLDNRSFAAGVRRAKSNGLFPINRPSECTLTRSYMTQRRDWIGKSFDFVYLHMHHYWGLAVMRCYQVLMKQGGVEET